MYSNWDTEYLEDPENAPDDMKCNSLHQNYILLTNAKRESEILMHLCLNFETFHNLWVTEIKKFFFMAKNSYFGLINKSNTYFFPFLLFLEH